MDIRELYADDEEALRSAVAGILKHHQTAFISILSKDSDGYTATTLPAVKRRDVAPDGTVSFNDHPIVPDQALHFIGGGGVTLTTAIKSGDEVLSVVTSRPYGVWKQSGGSQQPEAPRVQSMSDAVALSGVRSDPRRLRQVSTDATHLRSDDKLHVRELDPAKGHRTFSADPSTLPASDTFDPLSQASKFIDHAVTGAGGLLGRAVSGSTEHTHGVDHGRGGFMTAMGAAGLVQALAHPDLGGLISSAGGAHVVHADPEQGVMVQSQKAVQIASQGLLSISAPPGMMSFSGLAKGGIPGGAVQTGGDLSGSADQAKVVSLAHVDARALPAAGSDSAAASAGVALGGLYRNTAVAAGVSVLAVRMA